MHNPMKGASSIAKGYPRGSKELIGMKHTQLHYYIMLYDTIYLNRTVLSNNSCIPI